jgi:peptidoglycan/xylan/chitin deacetylase (PgdA/CDA1 family)
MKKPKEQVQMKRRTIRALAMLLCIAAVCLTLIPAGTASASAATEIPSGYVLFDGTDYYLIHFDELLDAYISYLDDPDCDEAALATRYFDILDLGFDGHFIAYVSGITHKYVGFNAVLDKYIDTEDIGETYGWFNSDAASSAFNTLTEVKVLGPDGNVAESVYVGADGYESVILIENPSVETIDPSDATKPENWTSNSWGSHTAVFSYLNEGHSGSRSVKVEVTEYNDGDAKWFFEPVSLEPRDYVFSDYYRANVDTRVVLAVTTDTGATKYIDLPGAPASENWTRYEASFTMPDDGVKATVYHLISRNGYLITDDYHIAPYNYEGFDRGLVTITFDDGWEGNTLTALPVMQLYGFKSTQYYATTYIETPWVPNPKELIERFINDGHEIGSHSITHPDLTTLPEAEVIQELEGSKQFLENYLGISVQHFATPYGAYNTAVKNSIMTYYDTHRTVDSGYNSKDNFDVSRLRSMSILSTTTGDEVQAWVEKAKEEKLWLILLYHRVADDPGEYDTTPELFAQHMQAISDSGLPVMTVSQALAELESQ